MDDQSPIAWFALGDQLLEMREYHESKRCFQQALALNPAQWQSHARLSILRVRTGNAAEGIARFGHVMRAEPDNPDAIAGHATLLEELGQFAEALQEAERAIHAMPLKLDHQLRAAGIEMQLGRFGGALARLDEAVTLCGAARPLSSPLSPRANHSLSSRPAGPVFSA